MEFVLIDDNYLDNFIHTKMLQRLAGNEEVHSFDAVDLALEYFRNGQGDITPRLIFLDLKMPVKDGFAFLAEFENLPPDTQKDCRIVVLSSTVSADDMSRACTSRLVEGFYSKPMRIEQLKALLTA